MNPAILTEHSHSEYREGTSLADMVREDLIAERIAIETYREIIQFFGDRDPTSRILMEEILAKGKSTRTTWRTCCLPWSLTYRAASRKLGHGRVPP